MKFFKDRMAVTSATILLTFGTIAWIKEGYFNVFTITAYSLALFVFLARTFGK